MSREPFASSNNDAENTDAESALSDDDLDGVVGGRGNTRGDPLAQPIKCVHGQSSAHPMTGGTCTGPFN